MIAPITWDGREPTEAYLGDGFMTNSGRYDGMTNEEGVEAISDDIERNGWGKTDRFVPVAGLAHLQATVLGDAHPGGLLP